MSSCCSRNDTDAKPCPGCDHLGPIVGTTPVRPHKPAATDGDWQFCANQQCRVVFHLGGDTVETEAVITQVGEKATDKPTPVCFCYAHTEEAIHEDHAQNGSSQVKSDINAAVADGLCACEHLNPSGKCCLADVHRTLKALTEPIPT